MKIDTSKLLLLAFTTTIAASASYAMLSPESEKPYINDINISEPEILAINNLEATSSGEKLQIISHEIKSGENLSAIFSDLEFSKTDLHNIVHANEIGNQFAAITPGKSLVAEIDSNGQLQQLKYQKNAIETLVATRIDDNFEVEIISKTIETKTVSTQATIRNSLFLDGKSAGLSDNVIMQLAGIFAWDIDFALNLRKGDQFTVVYQKRFVDDNEIDSGKIISAEFINRGRSYRAVRFEDKKGNASYFTPEGDSLRKAFLRTPIAFARVSSPFNLKRKHPVLNRIRAHKGVDYAASTGTPIKSTADGKIIYRGRKGGYGRVVIVQHRQKYSTLYAHMSKYRKGQKVGSRVKQGQTIGYVGKSGLATGPHLHYEFRINGRHRNPLTVKLPHSLPIQKSLLAEFKIQTRPLIEQLNKAKATNNILAKYEL